MRRHLPALAAAFALAGPAVVGLSFVASAEQTKNVPPATAKPPVAVANVPTVPPKVSTQIVLKPAIGYIGTYFVLESTIIMDGGKQHPWAQWEAAETCKIEVQVENWTPFVCERRCIESCQLPVPESKKEGGLYLKARYAAFGRMLASEWQTTSLTLYKSPTKLTLQSKKAVALPANIAMAEATSAGAEVSIRLTKSFNSGGYPVTYPVTNRAVVVNVPGGATWPVPRSDANGEIKFMVVRPNPNTVQVQIAFMGDSAYQPSSLSVTVP